MKCNQHGCDRDAVFEMVWMKPQQYCTEHAQRVIALGNFMGYPVPAHTIHVLPGISEEALQEAAATIASMMGGDDV